MSAMPMTDVIHNMPSMSKLRVAPFLWVAAFAVTAACTDNSPGILASADPGTVLSDMTISEHALNLATQAPYDTIRLAVSVRLGDGTALTPATPGAVYTYTASDTTVTVDQNGLITARFPSDVSLPPAWVIVHVQYLKQSRWDSAAVRVTTTPPAPGTLSVRLSTEPDSQPVTTPLCEATAVTSFFCNHSQQPLHAIVRTATGDTVTGAVVTFSSADTTIATIDTTGLVTGQRPGKIMIYVSTYAYGQHLRDSLRFTVTETDRFHLILLAPVGAPPNVHYTFSSDTVHIVAGGVIVWENLNVDSLDILFENPPGLVDSADASTVDLAPFIFGYPLPGSTGQGNIPPFAGDAARKDRELAAGHTFDDTKHAFSGYSQRAYRARRFPIAGRYPFHSNRMNIGGVIFVCADVCQ